jgi:hypothetical protein
VLLLHLLVLLLVLYLLLLLLIRVYVMRYFVQRGSELLQTRFDERAALVHRPVLGQQNLHVGRTRSDTAEGCGVVWSGEVEW